LTDWGVEVVSMTADIAMRSCLLNIQFSFCKIEVGSKFRSHVTRVDPPISLYVKSSVCNDNFVA
jgi:hypothetical protein